MTDLIPWLLWLIGIVGVGGAIALLVFAPALASVILRTVWSVASTPLGAAILSGGLCFMVGLGYGDSKGRAVELAKCQAEQARADAEAKQRDEQQGQLADQDAQRQLEELAAQHKKDQDLIDALRSASPAACHPITPDELDPGAAGPARPVPGPARPPARRLR